MKQQMNQKLLKRPLGYKLDRLFFATELVIEGIGMPFSNFFSLSVESYVSLSVQDFPNTAYKYNAQCSCCENYIWLDIKFNCIL
jgi:hypothetical protein